MKQFATLLAVVIGALTLGIGCGGEKQVIYHINTSDLEAAFANASGTVKEEIDLAVASINGEDILAAAEHMKNAAATGDLTPEQAEALYSAVAMVQQWMTNSAEIYNNPDYQAALLSVTEELSRQYPDL